MAFMPKARANGISIYYEEEGEGFPLVLLHPWPTDHGLWMFQVPVFSAKYRVITPDSRGLGKSDRPETGYGPTSLANDVNGLLDHLNIKKAFIVGLSLGGAVAIKFCIDHPEKVQGSIWVGAPRLPTSEFIFEVKDGKERSIPDVYLEALIPGGYLHFWNTVWKPKMGYLYHKDFVATPLGSYLTRYFFEDRYAELNKDASGPIHLIRGMGEERVTEEISGVRVPVAIVAGEDDPTLPYCKEQKQLLPAAEFYEIKTSGHMCIMDQAEEFNSIMWNFLTRHNP